MPKNQKYPIHLNCKLTKQQRDFLEKYDTANISDAIRQIIEIEMKERHDNNVKIRTMQDFIDKKNLEIKKLTKYLKNLYDFMGMFMEVNKIKAKYITQMHKNLLIKVKEVIK